jgi:hypothetical protein
VHWYENWGRKSARTSLVIDPADGRVPALTADAQERQERRARPMGSFGAGRSNGPRTSRSTTGASRAGCRR